MKKRAKLFIILCFIISSFVLSVDVQDFLRESSVFLSAFISKPTSVGAIFPSSSKLAKKITEKIGKHSSPIKVLEVGAGTGVFTERIIEKLNSHDTLDIIELDEGFYHILEKKYGHLGNVQINCMSVLDFDTKEPYDFIISGLPFNAFDEGFLTQVLMKYRELIKPGGIISYFEYIALAKIKLLFLFGKDRDEYLKTLSVVSRFRDQFEFKRKEVFGNIPPAYVRHLCIG